MEPRAGFVGLPESGLSEVTRLGTLALPSGLGWGPGKSPAAAPPEESPGIAGGEARACRRAVVIKGAEWVRSPAPGRVGVLGRGERREVYRTLTGRAPCQVLGPGIGRRQHDRRAVGVQGSVTPVKAVWAGRLQTRGFGIF